MTFKYFLQRTITFFVIFFLLQLFIKAIGKYDHTLTYLLVYSALVSIFYGAISDLFDRWRTRRK
ncbi:MAG: hypothetical protein Q4C56_00755 [Peptococcaceae bacterium]|nr:hypothetical protein [Peptococcaceae bacterium]